jgi:hypothetical protein
VSISRISFADTQDWREAIGFINNITLEYRIHDNITAIKKGSLVYGFKDGNDPTYGWLFTEDEEQPLETRGGTHYIVMGKEGAWYPIIGDFNAVRGMGANIPGIPWYTVNGMALIGKVFQLKHIATEIMTCDDAYRCELENIYGVY